MDAFHALVEAGQFFMSDLPDSSELAIPQNQPSPPDSPEVAPPSRSDRDRRSRVRASIANAWTKEDRHIRMVECLNRIDPKGNMTNNVRVARLVADPRSKIYFLNKTPEYHIDALLSLLDLRNFSSHGIVLDTCAGSDTINQRVQKFYPGLKFISNDANKSIQNVDQHKNILYERVNLGANDARVKHLILITSPPWAAAHHIMMHISGTLYPKAAIMAFHVSSDFASNAPRTRQEWLAQMVKEGRIVRIESLPLSENEGLEAKPDTAFRRPTWIVIFRNKKVRSLYTKPHLRGYDVVPHAMLDA
jgi:hypothetical protein